MKKRSIISPNMPSKKELMQGINEFEKHEKREAMYTVATFLINNFWGRPKEMANSIGVLLLTWNSAFYRFGSFDFDKLESSIDRNLKYLNAYRSRTIESFNDNDIPEIRRIFDEFNDSLKRSEGKKKNVKSPVSVAKCLHLFAPEFFPIWDDKIAKGYHCYYSDDPSSKYIAFTKMIKEAVLIMKTYNITSSKTDIKLVDQYNYSKFTKKWIK